MQQPDDFVVPEAAPQWFTAGFAFFAYLIKKRFRRLSEEMQLSLMKECQIPGWYRQVLMWRWNIVSVESLNRKQSSQQLKNCHFTSAEFTQVLDRIEIDAAWCLWHTGNWRRGTVIY